MKRFKEFILTEEQVHPQSDDYGEPVVIKRPHTPSSIDSWDSDQIATTVPGHENLPKSLNKLEFKSSKPPEKWQGVSGTGDFEEPEFKKEPGYKQSVGVAMVENGKVWVAHPTNQFGGYSCTLPKGTVEPNLTHRENAIKETHEETGLRAEITGHLGDYRKTTSTTRYYLGRRSGGHPSDMGWESQAVSLVPIRDLHKHMTNPSDQQIVKDIQSRFKGE
jgi:ADP-ribose pyrophosphatase YjhB (NUDIX family)